MLYERHRQSRIKALAEHRRLCHASTTSALPRVHVPTRALEGSCLLFEQKKEARE